MTPSLPLYLLFPCCCLNNTTTKSHINYTTDIIASFVPRLLFPCCNDTIASFVSSFSLLLSGQHHNQITHQLQHRCHHFICTPVFLPCCCSCCRLQMHMTVTACYHSAKPRLGGLLREHAHAAHTVSAALDCICMPHIQSLQHWTASVCHTYSLCSIGLCMPHIQSLQHWTASVCHT